MQIRPICMYLTEQVEGFCMVAPAAWTMRASLFSSETLGINVNRVRLPELPPNQPQAGLS